MSFRIVADSASDVYSLSGVDFKSVPLKIISSDREYVDDTQLDVSEMVACLKAEKTAATTSCPNMMEWLDAFEGADNVFAVAITSNLSGSYNAACIACEEYMAEHPGRKAHVFDSLSTGAEMHLIMDKVVELAKQGKEFEEIVDFVMNYKVNNLGLLFNLESMQNLANNGRVSHLVAKAAGLLNIRPLGIASEIGTLEMLEKPRGEKKAVSSAYRVMLEQGYKGGKVYITHCMNPSIAGNMKKAILADFPEAQLDVYSLGGLCSFYAEKGGMIVGFEKNL